MNPALYDYGFTYLVFPFNDAFIKANKIKTIAYTVGKSANRHVDEFDQNGRLRKTYWIGKNAQSKSGDTSYLEERIYRPGTGLLDTVISFDDRPLFTSVRCYQYDDRNRLEKVLKFGFTEIKQEEREKRKAADDLPPPVLPPLTEADPKLESADKSCVHGRPVDPSAFSILLRNNDFSSVHYRYYTKEQFAVEEQIELYDFSKMYGRTDTCKGKTAYYAYNGRVVFKFLRTEDCKGKDFPSERYRYKNGLLDSILSTSGYKPRDVQFTYDGKNNLKAVSNLWDGVKVSALEMLYDEKGLLKEARRESISSKSDFFMDAVLRFETTFF